MEKDMKSYFIKGFSLANHSLVICLLGIGLSLIHFFANYFSGLLLGNHTELNHGKIVVPLISFISIFFIIGYSMSVPLLLTFRQKAKPLDFNNFWAIILKNTKRMILPLILICLLTGALFITLSLAINNFDKQLNNWNFFLLILACVSALFAFVPIFFSIENIGFITSTKKSLSFSFRHLSFLLILILINALNYTFLTFLRTLIKYPFSTLISTAIGEYINFVIAASTLLFYQKYHNH
jgi:hypothetical protein